MVACRCKPNGSFFRDDRHIRYRFFWCERGANVCSKLRNELPISVFLVPKLRLGTQGPKLCFVNRQIAYLMPSKQSFSGLRSQAELGNEVPNITGGRRCRRPPGLALLGDGFYFFNRNG